MISLLEFHWHLAGSYGIVKVWKDNCLFYLSQEELTDTPIKLRCFSSIPDIPDLSKPTKKEPTEMVASFIVELNKNPEKYGQIKTQIAKQLELF